MILREILEIFSEDEVINVYTKESDDKITFNWTGMVKDVPWRLVGNKVSYDELIRVDDGPRKAINIYLASSAAKSGISSLISPSGVFTLGGEKWSEIIASILRSGVMLEDEELYNIIMNDEEDEFEDYLDLLELGSSYANLEG